MFPDMSRELAEKRNSFEKNTETAQREIYAAASDNLEGKNRSLTSAREAEEFIQMNCSPDGWA